MKKIINIIISIIMVILAIVAYGLVISVGTGVNSTIEFSSILMYYLSFNLILSVVFLVLSFFKASHNKLIIPALYLVVIAFLVINSSISYQYNITSSYYYSGSSITESLAINIPSSFTLIFYVLVLGFFCNTFFANKLNKNVSAYVNIVIFVYLAVKLLITNLTASQTFGSSFGTLAGAYSIVISTLLLGFIYSIVYQFEIINPTVKKEKDNSKKLKEEVVQETSNN